MKEIERRHTKKQQSKWNCRKCQKEQPPPPSEYLFCPECVDIGVEQAKEVRLQRVEHWMRQFGVPKGLMKYPEPLPGMEWVETYAKPMSRGLCLMGQSGVGKSVGAVLVIRRWLTDWADTDAIKVTPPDGEWQFVGCAGLVMRLQDSFRGEGDESAYKILKKLVNVPRLLIDDLGTEKPTEFVRQSIYYLINEREQHERQTIITTNFGFEEINAQYDTRIGSRIFGMCDVREIKGRDRRVERMEA